MKISKSYYKEKAAEMMQQFPHATTSKRKFELMYLAVKNLNSAQLSMVFDKIIGNNHRAPTVSDISELSAQYMRLERVPDKTGCHLCLGMGYFVRRAKQGESDYSFSCTCEAGDNYSSLQKWSDHFEDSFNEL